MCLNLHIAHFQLPGLQAVSKFYGGTQLLLPQYTFKKSFTTNCFVFALQLKYGS